MFRFFSVLIMFIKELIFDSKEEYNIKSSQFNTRKFIIFIILTLSIISSFIVSIKAYGLAKENIILHEQLELCSKK